MKIFFLKILMIFIIFFKLFIKKKILFFSLKVLKKMSNYYLNGNEIFSLEEFK
jgi:hypothetical protein